MVINTAELLRHDDGNRQLDPSDATHLERVIELQANPDRDKPIAAVRGSIAVQAAMAEFRRLG